MRVLCLDGSKAGQFVTVEDDRRNFEVPIVSDPAVYGRSISELQAKSEFYTIVSYRDEDASFTQFARTPGFKGPILKTLATLLERVDGNSVSRDMQAGSWKAVWEYLIQRGLRDFSNESCGENQVLRFLEHLIGVKAAVVTAHAQQGDDNCWMDITKVYEAAGLPPKDNSVGDQQKMLRNCEHYVKHVCTGGGPWKSYADLLEENKRLRQQLQQTSERAERHDPRC